jgi:hypothetical protein
MQLGGGVGVVVKHATGIAKGPQADVLSPEVGGRGGGRSCPMQQLQPDQISGKLIYIQHYSLDVIFARLHGRRGWGCGSGHTTLSALSQLSVIKC